MSLLTLNNILATIKLDKKVPHGVESMWPELKLGQTPNWINKTKWVNKIRSALGRIWFISSQKDSRILVQVLVSEGQKD